MSAIRDHDRLKGGDLKHQLRLVTISMLTLLLLAPALPAHATSTDIEINQFDAYVNLGTCSIKAGGSTSNCSSNTFRLLADTTQGYPCADVVYIGGTPSAGACHITKSDGQTAGSGTDSVSDTQGCASFQVALDISDPVLKAWNMHFFDGYTGGLPGLGRDWSFTSFTLNGSGYHHENEDLWVASGTIVGKNGSRTLTINLNGTLHATGYCDSNNGSQINIFNWEATGTGTITP
jgi:hypothetical protein